MTPKEVKLRFDVLAKRLWGVRQELEQLATHLTTDIDQNAARSILTDLTWAVENCTVLGLHQVGEALNDSMRDAQPHGQGGIVELVVIRATDLERAKRFYELLGLQLTWEKHGSGAAHYAAESGGVVFEIYPLGTGPSTLGTRLGFRVPSVAKVMSAVLEVGGEVLSPPTETPWGLRAVLMDPEGHRIEISQGKKYQPDPG